MADTFEDYPELTLRESRQQGEAALRRFEEEVPEEYLEMVMTTYFGTADWNKRAKVVDRAPMLLTPAVERTLRG